MAENVDDEGFNFVKMPKHRKLNELLKLAANKNVSSQIFVKIATKRFVTTY